MTLRTSFTNTRALSYRLLLLLALDNVAQLFLEGQNENKNKKRNVKTRLPPYDPQLVLRSAYFLYVVGPQSEQGPVARV